MYFTLITLFWYPLNVNCCLYLSLYFTFTLLVTNYRPAKKKLKQFVLFVIFSPLLLEYSLMRCHNFKRFGHYLMKYTSKWIEIKFNVIHYWHWRRTIGIALLYSVKVQCYLMKWIDMTFKYGICQIFHSAWKGVMFVQTAKKRWAKNEYYILYMRALRVRCFLWVSEYVSKCTVAWNRVTVTVLYFHPLFRTHSWAWKIMVRISCCCLHCHSRCAVDGVFNEWSASALEQCV